MVSVLLRFSGLDALDVDAESQPPYGELGASEQGIALSEGDAVVGEDGVGQSVVFEGPFEHREGERCAGGGKSFAGDEVAGAVIGDGQDTALLRVTELKLSVEVGAPQYVGLMGRRQLGALGLVATALAPFD